MYQIEIKHDGLNKYRLVKGATAEIVAIRAEMQRRAWNEQWARLVAAASKRDERQRRYFDKESKKRDATDQTSTAQTALSALESLLSSSLQHDHRIDWESLKDKSAYSVPEPRKPSAKTIPPEPNVQEARFHPKLNLIARLLPAIRKRKEDESFALFSQAHEDWTKEKADFERLSNAAVDQFTKDHADWQATKGCWLEAQQTRNLAIDKALEAYLEKRPESIAEYCEMVLHNSQYPDDFPVDARVDYVAASRLIVVDYTLPDIAALPTLKEVKYIATKDMFQPVSVSDAWLNKTYDSVLYQITLRSLHELFGSDTAVAIDSIIFNGWVTSTDKATGKPVTACILSVQANKVEFSDINLDQVDPKVCFKKLKGVSAAKLTALQPVRPILQLNKEDKRFISAYEVADELDTSSNLAAMDWEDFEQLIRELFEKEFSGNGGEVKVTRASRDGGVDAVAFDPDPIRGGKIIIQAKRYTHTVSVSAVRDLYGTVHNEGANKGILVTTADYGPDAYEFAKGKPITLLSGSELLFLLQKHGHKARIDLQEARLLNAEKAKTQGGSNPSAGGAPTG